MTLVQVANEPPAGFAARTAQLPCRNELRCSRASRSRGSAVGVLAKHSPKSPCNGSREHDFRIAIALYAGRWRRAKQ